MRIITTSLMAPVECKRLRCTFLFRIIIWSFRECSLFNLLFTTEIRYSCSHFLLGFVIFVKGITTWIDLHFRIVKEFYDILEKMLLQNLIPHPQWDLNVRRSTIGMELARRIHSRGTVQLNKHVTRPKCS